MALRRRTRARDSAAEALDRAVALLQGYQRAGATEVPVADVLAMLGANPEAEAATGPMPVEPGTDPLTGCRSVTPG
jgi:hypothetical protein